MPGAIRYVEPSDKWRSSLTPAILNEKQKRHQQYRQALKYYDGEHIPQLEVDDEDPDDNVAINLVKTAADRTASFLFSEMPVFETDPLEPDETPSEKYVRETFEQNGGLAFLTKVALRGFLSGHCFIRIRAPRAWETHPKMTLLNPLSVTVWWNADDEGDVLWYEHRYTVGDVIYVKDYVADYQNKSWKIYTYRAAEREERDIPAVPQEVGLLGSPGPHGTGYGPEPILSGLFDSTVVFKNIREEGRNYALHTSLIPPLVEWAHLPHPDNYYGQGEASNLDLQDTINRIWSEINRIVREHSDPLDVVLGADIEDIRPYSDGLLTIDGTNPKAQRLEFKGDLSAAVETANKLVETFLAIVRVVILKGEAKDLQRVTNAAVRTLFIDALAKNAQLQASYGGGMVKLARLSLKMSGKAELAAQAEEMPLRLKFANPLPVDQTEIANINALALAGKYRSRRTASTELGDTWVFEQAAMDTEEEEFLEKEVHRIEILGTGQPDEGNKPGTNPKAGLTNQQTAV